MTRKDFQLIASIISSVEMDYIARGKLVRAFVRKLSSTNPRFQPNTFYAACLADMITPQRREQYISSCYTLEKHSIVSKR